MGGQVAAERERERITNRTSDHQQTSSLNSLRPRIKVLKRTVFCINSGFIVTCYMINKSLVLFVCKAVSDRCTWNSAPLP